MGLFFVFWAAAILDLCKFDIFMVNINLNNNKTIKNGFLGPKNHIMEILHVTKGLIIISM